MNIHAVAVVDAGSKILVAGAAEAEEITGQAAEAIITGPVVAEQMAVTGIPAATGMAQGIITVMVAVAAPKEGVGSLRSGISLWVEPYHIIEASDYSGAFFVAYSGIIKPINK